MSTRRKTSLGCPSPATRRERHPDRTLSDRDIRGVLRPGLHVNGRHRVAVEVCDEDGLAVRRDLYPARVRADRDVGGVLGPGLHIDRRHRVAGQVGHEGGLPSGVTATPRGNGPNVMSVGFLVLVFTSIDRQLNVTSRLRAFLKRLSRGHRYPPSLRSRVTVTTSVRQSSTRAQTPKCTRSTTKQLSRRSAQ